MHKQERARGQDRVRAGPGDNATLGDQPEANSPPRLLDRVRERIRYRHYSYRTEQAYVEWVRRFVCFHGRRHPRDMGAAEIEAFLNHLANERGVAASTHNQALSALLFQYGEVLGIDLPWLGEIKRPRRPQRLPVVLTREEVRRMLALIDGVPGVMARLLYGTGIRTVQELLGHRDVSTTMIYTHVLNRGGRGVVSPLDQT